MDGDSALSAATPLRLRWTIFSAELLHPYDNFRSPILSYLKQCQIICELTPL